VKGRSKECSCGLEAVLVIIGGKWKLLILSQLDSRGPQRFGKLGKLIPGVSEKVLAQELKQMQEDGIVIRTDYKEKRARVEYSLTEFGKELSDVLQPLCRWGWDNRDHIGCLPRETNQESEAIMTHRDESKW
jgi:DNA-binding HxlR family transcriptional regulator